MCRKSAHSEGWLPSRDVASQKFQPLARRRGRGRRKAAHNAARRRRGAPLARACGVCAGRSRGRRRLGRRERGLWCRPDRSVRSSANNLRRCLFALCLWLCVFRSSFRTESFEIPVDAPSQTRPHAVVPSLAHACVQQLCGWRVSSRSDSPLVVERRDHHDRRDRRDRRDRQDRSDRHDEVVVDPRRRACPTLQALRRSFASGKPLTASLHADGLALSLFL